MEVVEGVERLRQPECVLREHRELERRDHLIDDLIEPRRLEHQCPELMAVVTGQLTGWQLGQRRDEGRFVEAIPFLQLSEDVVDADDRVLDVQVRSHPGS